MPRRSGCSLLQEAHAPSMPGSRACLPCSWEPSPPSAAAAYATFSAAAHQRSSNAVNCTRLPQALEQRLFLYVTRSSCRVKHLLPSEPSAALDCACWRCATTGKPGQSGPKIRLHPKTPRTQSEFGKSTPSYYDSPLTFSSNLRSNIQPMRKLIASLPFLALVLTGISFAQTQAPEPVLPYSPSLDVSSMDNSVDPCGGWQKKNPIPPDQVAWGVYGKLYQDNLQLLRGILEQAAAAKGQRDLVTQEIGNFYAACMDEPAVEKLGAGALKPELAQIAQLKSARDLAPLVARLQLDLGGSILFGSGSLQDPDNSEQQIAGITQGGL